MPCQPRWSHNWRAFHELFESRPLAEVAELLTDSPALRAAAEGASEPLGVGGCEEQEASWLRGRLSQLAELLAQPGGLPAAEPPRLAKRLAAPALGRVRPLGWLSEVLRKSAAGLAGHLFEFYPPIRDSGFLGGGSSYSSLFEDLPYALNGLVPLAAVTQEPRLLRQCDEFIRRVLETQGRDGWLGPDEWPDNEERGDAWRAGLLSSSIWARIPLLQALAQYSEVGVVEASRRSLACHAFHAVAAFCLALARRLDAGRAQLVAWSAARWPDLILTLNWLLAHPQGPNRACEALPTETPRRLRVLAWLARVQGFDWEGWFEEGTFPEGSLDRANFSLYSHGVNNAMSVKWGAVWSAAFGSASAGRYSADAWRQLSMHHGVPSGAFGADEHLAGPAPDRGTELCAVVESMRSLAAVAAMQPSDPAWGDALEALAFNALPAAVTDDHWAHQYLTQTNAVFAGLERPLGGSGDRAVGSAWHPASSEGDGDEALLSKTFGNTGIDATSYGLAPNFPCCTVNFLQGWPKLLALGAWLWDGGGESLGLRDTPALLSLALLPSLFELPGGGVAKLHTDYPLAGVDAPLQYALRGLPLPMALVVRVPGWALLEASTVAVAGGPKRCLAEFEERPGVVVIDVLAGDSDWEVRFQSRWRVWHRPPWGGGLILGPLTFVVPFDHLESAIPFENDGNEMPSPAQLRDVELVSFQTYAWAHAIAVNGTGGGLTAIAGEPRLAEYGHGFAGTLAFTSELQGCPLVADVPALEWPAWRELGGSVGVRAKEGEPWLSLRLPPLPAPSPLYGRLGEPPPLGLGRSVQLQLRPFGCTKLRLAQVPLFVVDGL